MKSKDEFAFKLVRPLKEQNSLSVKPEVSENARSKVRVVKSRRVSLGVWSVVLGLLLLTWTVRAQEFRGTISGTVMDPNGAALAGAAITVREVDTGTVSKTTSDAAGQYVVPFLLPGNYSITVGVTGFQTLTRNGITLHAQDHPIIDLTLKVGSASQTVTVTSAAPLLSQSSATISDVISTSSVADLPLNGRAPAMLAELSVGVETEAAPEQSHPFDNNNMNSFSIGGTPLQSSEVLMDGSPDETLLGALAFSPTEDSVQEVSVQPFATDASFGHTIGGVMNEVTKSGTNQLHGTAYEFGQISGIDANTYFNDRSQKPLPVFHFNQYGLSAGGPVWIPKVVNGRNKLFWFFAWEGLKDSTPATTLLTVPTDAEKQGDFSALLGLSTASPNPYQIYEPFTGTFSNGATSGRTPVPNNCLTNQSTYCSGVANAGYTVNPIAVNYLKLFPEPNDTTDVKSDGADNYISNAPSIDDYNEEFGRMDYNVSSRDHLFFDFRQNYRSQIKEDYYNNTNGSTLIRQNWGSTLDNVYTLNPTTVLDVRFNWTYFYEAHDSPAAVYSPTQMGFSGLANSALPYVEMPVIKFNGSSYEDFNNTASPSYDPTTSYQLFADVIKTTGKHTLKFGFDGRQYRMRIRNFDNGAGPSGSFTFGNNWITAGTGQPNQTFGGDMASFELGLANSGGDGFDNQAEGDYRSYYFGLFAQDDWRVNNRLTLNLGVRFDIDSPFGEKFGRTVDGFDPTAPNSASGATWNSADSVTENGQTFAVNQSTFNTLGGITFPGSSWGAPYQIADNHGFFSPRIGFSYNPPWLSDKMVVRGGFAMFVQPQTLSSLNASGTVSSNAESFQSGFSASTTYTSTLNSYYNNCGDGDTSNPCSGGTAFTLGTPFPTLVQPAGSSAGASTFLGESISFFAPNQHDAYSERWNLGVQHQISPSTLVEAIYVGNHALHLTASDLSGSERNLNAVQKQYMNFNPYPDYNLSKAAGTAVPNPFAGLLPLNKTFNAATEALGDLLVPYPQFGNSGIYEVNETIGQSWYNAAMLHVEQRASHGLTLTANYNFSKLIEQDDYLNDQDTTLEKRVSPFDHAEHFTVGAIYELPFGKGKMYDFGGSRLMDELLGGYVINGIYQFESGPPIVFTNNIPLQPGMTVKDIKSQPRNTSPTTTALVNASTVFDTGNSSCTYVASSQPCDGSVYFPGQYSSYDYRTLPTTIGSVRADGYNNLDASILKDFAIHGEGTYFQLRFETFNTLNHAIFASPNVSSATSSTFGFITGTTANSLPRQIQIGGRLVF
ncbi:MAG TPA: carboxypeptidase regulatory-like domain-containing protein [Terracidiphilus sp.]|nr:carboxypeptidase regulatory-like domain-containing protein [Terracidiphilus sp.]